jgi:hypothetical protein
MSIHNFGSRGAEPFWTATPKLFFVEFGDALREPRNLPAGGIAVHYAVFRRANERRLGLRHRRDRALAVAGGESFLDLTHGRADA